MVKVYVKTDEMNRIIEINSDIFLGQDVDGWTLIDEGEGDRYVHAQSNYLTDGLIDSGGLLRWKLGPDDQLILRSEQELAEDMAARPPMADKLDELQSKLDTLTAWLEVQEADNGVIYEALRTGGLTPLPVPGETWDRAKWYRSGDMVTQDGIGYTCVKTCKGKSPSLENYWEVTPEEAEPIPWEDILSGDMIAADILVTHNDETWRCIKEHIKSVVRQPSAMQTDYWEAVT